MPKQAKERKRMRLDGSSSINTDNELLEGVNYFIQINGCRNVVCLTSILLFRAAASLGFQGVQGPQPARA